MKRYILAVILGLFILFAGTGQVTGEENGIFSGRVMDVADNPVAGAEVYVYGNTNIRRPADFISPPTGESGDFRIALPPGSYWTVARLRHGKERFGPLLPGDKHSGALLEIDIMPGENVEEDFVVADLEETSRLAKKVDTSFIKIEGVLLTKQGEPVENGYAFANLNPAMKKIPDYVSAWTDSSGRYTFYLQPGTYYFSMGREFPPGPEPVKFHKVSIDSDMKNNDIVINE